MNMQSRQPARVSADQHRLFGGRLCLDFVNTIEPRVGPTRHDYLHNFADLVAWELHAGVLSQEQASELLQKRGQPSQEAEDIFARALELREALYRIFMNSMKQCAPNDADMGCLNQLIGRRQVRASGQGFTWDWRRDTDALEYLLWPLADSAAELLTSRERSRVKACPASDGCGWLFVDTSKNGSRRYCNMAGCGNRARFRRYYARKRDQSPLT